MRVTVEQGTGAVYTVEAKPVPLGSVNVTDTHEWTARTLDGEVIAHGFQTAHKAAVACRKAFETEAALRAKAQRPVRATSRTVGLSAAGLSRYLKRFNVTREEGWRVAKSRNNPYVFVYPPQGDAHAQFKLSRLERRINAHGRYKASQARFLTALRIDPREETPNATD